MKASADKMAFYFFMGILGVSALLSLGLLIAGLF